MKARKDKTMKRTLLTLVALVVGVCLTCTSCSSSEEAPIEFSFPTQITQSMGADDSKSISIEHIARLNREFIKAKLQD